MEQLGSFLGMLAVWAALYVGYTMSIKHYQQED